MGVSKVIACGGAGSLEPELTLGHVIVPASAVRDEGTSYHYLPPSRDIEFDADVVMCLEDVLRKNKVPYVVGKTWTTDAIYRETRARVARRRNEGCIAVEMEAASLLAVAKFRGVQLGYLLLGPGAPASSPCSADKLISGRSAGAQCDGWATTEEKRPGSALKHRHSYPSPWSYAHAARATTAWRLDLLKYLNDILWPKYPCPWGERLT